MKTSKQAAAPSHWHPNFRIPGELPDIKVIRTSFAINATSAAVVVALGAFLYQREAATSDLRGQVAEWQNTIAGNRPRYDKAIQLQKEFSNYEKRVREIEVYAAPRLVSSEFLRLISESLPRLITLDQIQMYGDGVRLHGSVVGATEHSAPLAKEYAGKLAAHPVLAAQMESVKLNRQERDQAGDRFTFEIELKLKTRK